MVLDVILLAVMLISALLAMVRGFMREVLSIASWAAAAVATLYFPQAADSGREGVPHHERYRRAGVIGRRHFFGTLIVVAVITIKISDTVLDSRIGALDRTLGFLFGLGRGLVIVVVAFLFFTWLVPDRSQPEWVNEGEIACVVLKKTGEWIVSMLPETRRTPS